MIFHSAFEIYYLIALLIIGGALTGVFSGLFGIGGGTLLVPLLYELTRFTSIPEQWHMQVALGTSLAIIAPTSLVSYLAHKKKGLGDEALLRTWRIPVLFGVIVGATLASFAPTLFLKVLFSMVCGFTALRLIFDPSGRWRLGQEMPKGEIALTGQGIGIGFLSALLGLGGGLFSTLLMTLYNRPIHQAVATSSGIGVIVSLPGALSYMVAGAPHMKNFPPLSLGFVSFLAVLLISPLSAFFVRYGVRLAHYFEKRRLELIFATYLCVIAARFCYDLMAN